MTKIFNLDDYLFDYLTSIAAKSTCHRSKCGSIIIDNGEIIGYGYLTTL
jgi:deoxycytidylate deaminase